MSKRLIIAVAASITLMAVMVFGIKSAVASVNPGGSTVGVPLGDPQFESVDGRASRALVDQGFLQVGGTCTGPIHKVVAVGVTAAACPTTQKVGRRVVTLCNSAENTGTPLVKIRIDGATPVMGTANAGDVLKVDSCVTYSIPSTVIPSCITDTAGTALTVTECS